MPEMGAVKARLNQRQTDSCRDKIRTSHIIKKLTEHIDDTVEMGPTQVTAALGLLKKTLPDLKVTEHKGHIKLTASEMDWDAGSEEQSDTSA